MSSYSYLGKNADGTIGLFDDNNLQNAIPGSVTQALNADGSSFSGTGTDIGSGMDWLNNYSKGIGTLIGAGGLGLSAYDTFLGNTAKTNKKNLKILDQQIASNDYTMGKKKEFDTMMSNVKVPTGLASTVRL